MAYSAGTLMTDSVLDVLLYLFETYSDQDNESSDQDVLRDELLRAGFAEPEVDSALDWLDSLGDDAAALFASPPTERALRLYNLEMRRLDASCRGYLLYLEQVGILGAEQRERVIERLMALGSASIDKEQVKWVVLMLLFSQPSQQTALARMENLVFEESTGAVH
jgi:Smg protein